MRGGGAERGRDTETQRHRDTETGSGCHAVLARDTETERAAGPLYTAATAAWY